MTASRILASHESEASSKTRSRRILPGGVVTAGVLIWNDVVDDGRDAFYRWHDGEHMPERMSVPGFIRGRRYASQGSSPQWFTLYEASSLEVLVSPAYLDRLNNPTPATQQTLRHFRHTARSLCRLLRAAGQGVGGHALVLRLDGEDPRTDQAETAAHAFAVLERVEELTGVVGTSLYGADTQASRIETAESRTRSLDVPVMTLMVECSNTAATLRARDMIRDVTWKRHGLSMRAEHGLFSLEHALGPGWGA